MPKKLIVTLNPAQQLELVQTRDKHEKPYLRERVRAQRTRCAVIKKTTPKTSNSKKTAETAPAAAP